MKKEKEIIYFGYGANANKDMMKALIGRVPKSFSAKLEDYGLFVQSWNEIPFAARKFLKHSWDSSFQSYIAVPLKGNRIFGTAWKITQTEREMIGKWELHYHWYFPVEVKIKDEKGKTFKAKTEIIYKYKTNEKPIVTKDYPSFVAPKKKMLKLANEDREEFLENTS